MPFLTCGRIHKSDDNHGMLKRFLVRFHCFQGFVKWPWISRWPTSRTWSFYKLIGFGHFASILKCSFFWLLIWLFWFFYDVVDILSANQPINLIIQINLAIMIGFVSYALFEFFQCSCLIPHIFPLFVHVIYVNNPS